MIGKIKSNIYNLKIPLSLSKDEKSKYFPIFNGITAGLLEFSCHLSTHAKGHCPHDLHSHSEEEILFLISGSIKLVHTRDNDLGRNKYINLNEGRFIYYPANFPHTFISTGKTPANCLALHWKTNSKNKNPGLKFSYFVVPDYLYNPGKKRFFTSTLFEHPTLYLNKLHCHTSVIYPGGSIDPHSDAYDVVSVILQGEVETLGKKATPYDVIFYSTGEPHGIYNRVSNPAREIVFEFHTNKVISIDKIPYLLNYYFSNLMKLNFWKKNLKKIIKLILPAVIIKSLKKIKNNLEK